MTENTTPSNAGQLDPERPFMGLLSFNEKHKAQFGGRDVEIAELFKMVENNPLTIVFGKSGIGKTSLLQAGLLPELHRNFYFPVYFRIDYTNPKSPLVQLKEFIYTKIKLKYKTAEDFSGRTLWEYFHDVKIQDGLVTPVLILDQFEETFTVGRDRAREVLELIIELSDLAENRVPLVVQQKYQDRKELIPPQYAELHYRVVFSLREDYLAQLEGLKKYLPSIKNGRYRIVQMTALQAMDAVMKPAKNLIEPDIAKEIIKKLPGVTDSDFDALAEDPDHVKRLVVEPFLLSLICFQINEKRLQESQPKITFDLVASFEINDVISSYYDDSMKLCGYNVRVGIEDTLLTERGYRKLETLEALVIGYKINEDTIQILIDKRILRKELRDEVEYVELIHDVLAPVIKRKRDQRIRETQEREKSESIRRAIELDRNKRKKYLRTAVTIVGCIFIGMIIYYAKKNAAESQRLRNLVIAQKLLATAKNVAETYNDYESAALISRTAFLIHKENKGEDENAFYNGMYMMANKLKVNFRFSAHENTELRSMVIVDNDVYSGYIDGKLLKSTIGKEKEEPHLLYAFNNKITSIAASADKNYLAVAGIFDDVQLFGLREKTGSCIKLTVPFKYGNKKNVAFKGNGNIVLRLDTALVEWNSTYQNPLLWVKRSLVKIANEKTSKWDAKVEWNKNFLTIPGVQFKCMSVYGDVIATGMDSGFVLIKKDSVILFTSTEIDSSSTTSIQFDVTGKYLYIGKDVGTTYRVFLANNKIEKNWNQTGRVLCMMPGSSKNYLALGSKDGTIAVYDSVALAGSWKDATPLILALNSTDSINGCYSIGFNPELNYAMAAYQNGEIYNWPVNADLLADIICNNVKSNLDSAEYNKYFINLKITQEKLNSYNCIH